MNGYCTNGPEHILPTIGVDSPDVFDARAGIAEKKIGKCVLRCRMKRQDDWQSKGGMLAQQTVFFRLSVLEKSFVPDVSTPSTTSISTTSEAFFHHRAAFFVPVVDHVAKLMCSLAFSRKPAISLHLTMIASSHPSETSNVEFDI